MKALSRSEVSVLKKSMKASVANAKRAKKEVVETKVRDHRSQII
jgi:hypothetical protein